MNMWMVARILGLSLLAGGTLSVWAQDVSTRTVDVTDAYHGVTVRDPYRWLEDAAAAEVKAWTAAQNVRTRAFLDALPQHAKIKARLTSLISGGSTTFSSLTPRGEQIFAMRNDPAKQQPMLVVLNALADPDSSKLVLDPNVLGQNGNTTIDWFSPSADGRLVAVSLSQNGSEIGTLHLYETATGREVGETIPRVQAPTGGGSLAWNSDGSGFWYTRYPGEERPEEDRHFYQQAYFHKIGSDWRNDALVLGTGDGLPRIAAVVFSIRHLSGAALAQVQNGDGGEYAHYLLRPDSALKLAAFEDKIPEAAAGPDGAIYALSRAGAPNGKVVKLRPPFAAHSLPRAETIVPEGEAAIEAGGIVLTQQHLLVVDVVGGPNQVRVFDLNGTLLNKVPLAESAAVGSLVPIPDGSVLHSVHTYLRPSYVARWNPATGKSEETKLVDSAPFGFDDVEVVRELAISKDGTEVPVDIIRKKGAVLDGSNPTILYGYGGYGVNIKPGFLDAWTRLWLDGGGIYAVAIIRGGAEFGERWHLDGNLTRKQNVFDDFAAAARHLIARKYTSSPKLALLGGSNGGLLVGATLTQNPALARAVVSQVGIYDMLRVELAPNGAFNVTEFGTVKDAEQFKALHAYSPYHHVTAGARYPAMLLTTGENDGRVDPLQSRKFAAAMQAATGSGLPVLLRTSGAGHGQGSSRNERIDEEADILAFLYDQLGMTWRDVATPPPR
jgi:prolyl oligopeptidase